MKSFIRNLSVPAEFLLVVFVCFGWGILGSMRQFVGHLTHTAQPEHLTNAVALRIFVMQLLVLAFVFWIGRIRGWPLASLGTRISWKDTAAGVLLYIITVAAWICCIVLTNIIAPGLRSSGEAGVRFGGLGLPLALLLCLVNPIYEEVIGTGYFIFTLKRYGMWPAVLASALFRTFLHSYRGIDAIVLVLPMGLIFGFVYWRWRQLWPLVVAHILIDLWVIYDLMHAA